MEDKVDAGLENFPFLRALLAYKRALLAYKEKEKKINATFRLSSKVVKQFKKACQECDIPNSQVLEGLMEMFIEGSGPRKARLVEIEEIEEIK